jgi:hypothetical protein
MKETNPKIEPSVNFNFEKKPIPKEVGTLELDDPITVSVTGKVKSVRKDEWGSGFSMSISKVEVLSKNEKPKGVGEAMELMKSQRRI